MKAPRSCAACGHWDRYEGGEDSLSTKLGDCRRYPPRISETLLEQGMPGRGIPLGDTELELAVYPASAFPVTEETSICGEFNPAKYEAPK